MKSLVFRAILLAVSLYTYPIFASEYHSTAAAGILLSGGSAADTATTTLTVSPDYNQDCLVVGAGSIGSSFCAVFLAQGKRVICSDPFVDEAVLHERIAKVWPSIRARGLSRKWRPPFGLLTFEPNLEAAVPQAGFIQECTYENVQSKQRILGDLDRWADPGVLIASSTSFIPHKLLVTGCKANKDRILVAHPTIPHLDCFMEIFGTSDECVERAREWYGKSCFDVVVMHKTIPGHLFNSFLTLNFRHASKLVRQGVCSPQDVNTVLRHLGRDFYARNSYLTLLSTIGGDGGMESGRELSDSIKDSAIRIVFFSLMKKLWMPDAVANGFGRLMSKLLANVVEPPPPPAWIEACRELEERLTEQGNVDVQTGLFRACSRMYERMPYEVENDPFELQT